ncbi:MAG: hypothetical protein V2I82_15225 [Halieaceae bacterium]|jgi:F-type H+-transporting ATPase subunit b|nr:hypothetical protein [Halieaceae bacterium]
MLIDWFTVAAQVLNFLILVWLLRRFLYTPILDAIDAREQRIDAELTNARAKETEAERERDKFRHKNEELDGHRADLLKQAAEEAKAEGQRLLQEARKATEAFSTERMETLRNEARAIKEAISLRTQHEVFAIARKALKDLATSTLEERLGDVFMRRLREMDEDTKHSLGATLKGASEPALVRSAFELPEAQRLSIQNALNETFSADIPLRFDTEPGLVSGIELKTSEHKVAWTIDDYLASMESSVDEFLRSLPLEST